MSDNRAQVFGVPPGADFPKALVEGLTTRFEDSDPGHFARIQVFVNTRRMQRRIASLFDKGPARLLPRIQLVTDLGRNTVMPGVPASVPPLRRRLELAQLVSALLDQDDGIAPRAALYDLSDSLARILDEMQGEGVGRAELDRIDAEDSSDHWRRRRQFLDIVLRYLEAGGETAPDPELRQRLAVESLIAEWRANPPAHPIILAGSTGSRGTTSKLMEAIAGLPQGYLVLPGFDFDLPSPIWDRLTTDKPLEDHPQYRYAALLGRLGLKSGSVEKWGTDTPASPERNRLVSLALRPAPVTHQWLTEGPELGLLTGATSRMTLVEAPNPRVEAAAIALRLRQAVEDGQTAALITPDRMLTRRVAAALDRWGIEPDDSAGQPLALSPPGRFLRHIAELFGKRLTVEDILVLLKHPLAATGSTDRNRNLLWTRELELHLRRNGPPYPTGGDLIRWAKTYRTEDRIAWAQWIDETIGPLAEIGVQHLTDHVATLLGTAERLAAGPDGDDSGELWLKAPGRKALVISRALTEEAPYGGDLSPSDFVTMLSGILNREEVRDPVTPHPQVMIWGTLEARVQGADLVILGSLNDGVWPGLPNPDPWLNREMRAAAGLLSPERQIGLSAHDFQQAIAAPEVMVTRALRDAEAETIPSRWLNRLTSLLSGLPDTGKSALDEMRARGEKWLAWADALEPKPLMPNPAPRPAPVPPVKDRPRQLSVTRIQTLIRDPYAVYAREILGLAPIDPMRQKPNAPIRGTLIHAILDEFISDRPDESPEEARARLLVIADRHLQSGAPWPVARTLWRAALERVASSFIEDEIERARIATPVLTEGRGKLYLDDIDFTVVATADRIDRTGDGRLIVYDYKTGRVPTKKEIEHFDKQLLLEVVMAEAGAFETLDSAPVDHAAHIGLGSKPGNHPIELTDHVETINRVDVSLRFAPGTFLAGFKRLIRAFDEPDQGYPSRRIIQKERTWDGDYDHLARFGEWDQSTPPTQEVVP